MQQWKGSNSPSLLEMLEDLQQGLLSSRLCLRLERLFDMVKALSSCVRAVPLASSFWIRQKQENSGRALTTTASLTYSSSIISVVSSFSLLNDSNKCNHWLTICLLPTVV